MNQKKYIRKKETKFIKDKLKEKKNLLVVGEKGAGKTTIIEQATKKDSKWFFKKLLSIDLIEVQNTKNLSYYLCFKGKNHLFLEKLCKNFVKIFSICISLSVLMYSIVINLNNDWNYFFGIKIWLPLSPIILFLSMLFISWSINALFNIFSKKWNFKIIHFHELNFINDKDKRKELLKIIWKIKNIYKNHLVIFESDEKFDQELKYKFDLKEIHLKTINKWFLIKNLFKDLEKEIENDQIKQKLLERLIDWTYHNQRYLNEIIYKLTYRTFKNIIEDFKDVYLFSKQAINLIDFLFLKFLQLKDTKLYYEIMKDEVYDELIKNVNSSRKEAFMEKIRLLLPQFSKYIEDYTHSGSSIFTNLEEAKINSFFKPMYKSFYFSSLNYNFLEMELIEKFQNEPLVFLKKVIEYNLNEIESFNFLEDEKIIQFLDFIENQSSEKILNLFFKNNVFITNNVFLNLKTLIINSRKDLKKFFKLLPLKYKYYFFNVLKNYFLEEKLKKIKNFTIPFKINQMPKNLILFSEECDGNKVFNWINYYKNLIKNKNKLGILLNSTHAKMKNYSFDKAVKENNYRIVILWNFLSTLEKSFVIKCFDECNKKVSKNNKWIIKKVDLKANPKKSILFDLSDQELEKYRNYQK